jgi:anionic cell wall polymer biosynthesis LytR-Cps2A-Psr (LCP) family protein
MGKNNRRIIVLCVLASLAIVLMGAGVLIRTWIRMPEIPQPPVIEGMDPNSGSTVTQPIPVGDRKEGVYTFLVAGRDVASGSTDTMLLLSFDANAKTIHGLNLPRDTMVNSDDYNKRLNAVYSYNRGKDKATQAEKGMTALKEVMSISGDYIVDI